MDKSGRGKIERVKPQTDTVATRFSSTAHDKLFIRDWDKEQGCDQARKRSDERYAMGQQKVPVVPPS